MFGGKVLLITAAVWAAGVSLYFFFSPVTIHTVTATTTSGGAEKVESSTLTMSWYQVQGLWGTVVLVLFAGLYILAIYLAWRSAYYALALLSLATLIISFLAGFSIGLFYLPSALALLIGTALLWLPKLMISGAGSSFY